jgi:hypothetical protein
MKGYIKSFINIFTNKKVLFLFFVLVVALLLGTTLVEGFDLPGSSSLSSINSSNEKPIPDQYKYLAPLPEGSVWSPELQDKFVAKLKSLDPNSTVTKDILNNPIFFLGNKTFMQSASSEEAEYFIDNGMWPYDDYIINYLTKEQNPPASLTDIENTRKQIPNRGIYNMVVVNRTVPQLKMLNDIFLPIAHKTDNGKEWYCMSNSLLVKDDAGSFIYNKDFSFFPSNIPGFSFEGDACNVCDIPQVAQQMGAGAHSNQEIYDSPFNKCKFKMSGEIPEAYNIYLGKYGNSSSKSVPASATGEDYQTCVSSCDKFKK